MSGSNKEAAKNANEVRQDTHQQASKSGRHVTDIVQSRAETMQQTRRSTLEMAAQCARQAVQAAGQTTRKATGHTQGTT